MEEKQEIFVDGIGQIHFLGGMIRYDMVTLDPNKDGKDPISKEKVRIIMSPDAFLAAFNTMQSLIDKLLDKGVFKKVDKVQPNKNKLQ